MALAHPLPQAVLTQTAPATASGSDNHLRASDRTDADFAAHIEQLKKKLPSEDFTIVVQKPFVVIGDEPADDVKEHSVRTVKWAVDKLKQEYFSKDPKEIIDIWLFKRQGFVRTERATVVRRTSRRRRMAITRRFTKPW